MRAIKKIYILFVFFTSSLFTLYGTKDENNSTGGENPSAASSSTTTSSSTTESTQTDGPQESSKTMGTQTDSSRLNNLQALQEHVGGILKAVQLAQTKSDQQQVHQVLVLKGLLKKLLQRTPTKKIKKENIEELDEAKLAHHFKTIVELRDELLARPDEPYVVRVNAALNKLNLAVNERSPGYGPLDTNGVIYFTKALQNLQEHLKETETASQQQLKNKLDALVANVVTIFEQQKERISLQETAMLHLNAALPFILIPASLYLLYKKVPGFQRLCKRAASYVQGFFIKPPSLALIRPRQVTFKDIIGLDAVVRKLRTIVELHLDPKKAAEAKKMGVTFPRGILFEGPPGVGKTMLAKAFANELGSNFFYASATDFHCGWIGEGKEKVASLFKNANQHTPAVIFLDEIDAIGISREESSSHQDTKATLNELLTQMDGFKENRGIIVLAATNRASSLDTALLSRFSEKVSFILPNLENREKILIHYMNQVPYIAQLPLHQQERFYFLAKWIAQQTIGFSARELQHFVDNAVRRAFTEGSTILTDQHFIDTLSDTLQRLR